MNSRLLATIIIFPIWLVLILVFRKHRQWLLYYMVAAFGLTIQIVFLAEYFGLDQLLVNLASFHVSIISKYLFHIPMEILSNGRFQMTLANGTTSVLKLGIECSAILESAIVVSLVVFYPLFNSSQKILRAIFGLVVTYALNIVRLMIIVLMSYKFGPDYIFIAHAGVARLFFFAFELVLYWYLMTKPTVKSVGDSIQEGVPLNQTATVGHSFQRLNAVAQAVVIILIIGLSLGSFRISQDWQKAFVKVERKDRPIIYKDETNLQPSPTPAPQAVLGAQNNLLETKEVEGVIPKEYSLYEREINRPKTIGLDLSHHQPVLVEAYVNGKLMEISLLQPTESGISHKVFYQPLALQKGDWLEIKVYNEGQTTDNYIFKINLIEN